MPAPLLENLQRRQVFFEGAQAFWQTAPGRNTGKGTKSVAGTEIAFSAKDYAERSRSTPNTPTRPEPAGYNGTPAKARNL
jgi:hypothetical protein